MTFAIVADLPLGTYRGRAADGRPERVPSVTRLHSALLAAAGFGPRAVASPSGELEPCGDDQQALRWLENNPPDGVVVPALELSPGRVVAYRNDGTLKKAKSVLTTKRLAKAPDAGTAVAGRFVWLWHEAPPAPVRAALERLCPDVPYLGTTESPVRLAAVDDDVRATHVRDDDAGMFDPDTMPVEVPRPGRLAELVDACARATEPPTLARDKPGTDEQSLSDAPPRRAVTPKRYRAAARQTVDVPWSRVVLLPMAWSVPPEERVRWAVAAHRALVSVIGEGASALVTGVYPDGVRRPANRAALQVLGPGLPVAGGSAAPSASLAVLVPRDADPGDVAQLYGALKALTSLRGPGGRTLQLDPARMEVLPGDAFWPPPAKGHVRLWRTEPAAVPDTRGQRGLEWTFAHAALLSLAFVWKALLPPIPGRGAVYHRGLIDAVGRRGAAVLDVSAMRVSDVARYVHRVNATAVVRPYNATLWLGDLSGPGTIQAIGQSRHLGGGLLVPLDVPGSVVADEVPRPGNGSAR